MKRSFFRQKGTGLIENLVAISLLTISLTGATSLFISSYSANASSRAHGALISDIHSIIDQYRQTNFSSLLDQFGINYAEITDGQTVNQTQVGTASRATYTISFTAIKSSSTNIPEAVRIRINAVQRRGKFSQGNYSFETLVAQTR